MWVYKQSEPFLWTVGFYNPAGRFEAESDHSDSESAANRVSYLNGSPDTNAIAACLSECFPEASHQQILDALNQAVER